MTVETLLPFIVVTIIFVGLIVHRIRTVRKIKKEEARLKEEEDRIREANRIREEQQRLAALEADRLRRQTILDQFMPDVREMHQRMLQLKTGYVANYPYLRWQEEAKKALSALALVSHEDLQIDPYDAKAILDIKVFCYEGDLWEIDNHNAGILKQDLIDYKELFDTAAGKPLDDQQRRAVITDEDNNLIIAGAGSGKTTTIVGKVKYLVSRYNVNPSRILLISFTRKSADDLNKRVNVGGTVVKTFHSFGLSVVTQALGYRPSIADANDFENRIGLLLEHRLKTDTAFQQRAASFYLDGLRVERPDDDFASLGEYVQYLKDQDFSTLKMVKGKGKGQTTLRREQVKSAEECKIANFLYLHNIDYRYEAPYEYEKATLSHKQYRPDFTLKQGDTIVYLEHFGINIKGEVPKWFAKQPNDDYSWRTAQMDYVSSMKWKRKTHTEHGTVLIETYSHENTGRGNLLQKLDQKLREVNITPKLKSAEEIWKIVRAVDDTGYKAIIKLMATFIVLMKSNNIDFVEVDNRVKAMKDKREQDRATYLCSIIRPIYEDYQAYLAADSLIDFSDMINMASDFIRQGRYRQDFDYVIIDEFQDTSISRFRLVEALKLQNPYCKLFCVGDDWQSIYRFAGSDIALFKEFETYFGVTEKLKIETTYRYHEPLIKTSGDFIAKNPNQAVKKIKSGQPHKKTTYEIVYFNNFEAGQSDLMSLDKLLWHLQQTVPGMEKKEILLLGRYNFDTKLFKADDHTGGTGDESNNAEADEEIVTPHGTFQLSNETSVRYKSPAGELTMPFLSVHRAKGMEADIVILLNCRSGKYGFPSQMSDDPVLNLLLSDADQFENGEERRLFYVAMTRAKEQVYFLTDQVYKSKFIAELERANPDSKIRKCPRCIEGDIVLKTSHKQDGTISKFYGCTNYTFGCEYTKSAFTTRAY